MIFFQYCQNFFTLYTEFTFFWSWALMVYIPLSLMDVARDRDENSTDPWLSFTVFNHSRCRAVSL